MLYLNLSTIALKKLREEAKRVTQERRERSNARVEAAHRGGAQSPGTPKCPGKRREGDAEGKHTKERVAVASSPKKLRKRRKTQSRGGGETQSRGGGEGSCKVVTTELSEKISGNGRGHEKDCKNRPPSISSLAPSLQPDSSDVLEKCKRMELKLTRCDGFSSCSSSGDEVLFKTSQFYSPTEPKKQSLRTLTRQSSKNVAAVVQSRKEEGKRADFKIKKVRDGGVRTSHTSSFKLKGSVQVGRTSDGEQQRPMHGKRKRTRSEVEPDISVEDPDLVAELFGNSPESDNDAVWTSESDKEGMSFESALAMVDSSTRKPVLKRRRPSHKEKTSSHATGKGHKKARLSSGATKSKSVQRPVSEQDDSVELKSPTESKPLISPAQATKSCRGSVPSPMDQVDTVGTGIPEKSHWDLRTLKRKHSDSLEVRSPLGVKSPPLLASPGAESSGPSHQLLPGPFINLTKLAAEHSRKKTVLPLSSRKLSRGSTGSDRDRKTLGQTHTKPSQKPSFTIFKKKEVTLTGTQ